MTRNPKQIVQIVVANLALCLAACSGPSSSGTDVQAATGAPDTGIESSEFAQVLCANSAFPLLAVATSYEAILQRGADEGGLNGHAASVASSGLKGWTDDIRIFVNSDEFKDGILQTQSNRDILERLYLGFLKRGLDADGAKIFLRMMNEKGIAETAIAIATSDEYFSKIFPFAQMDTDRFLRIARKVFQAALGRQPSANELNTASNEFAGRGLRGLYDMIAALAKGTEQAALIPTKSSDTWAAQFFNALVARAPNATELKRASDAVRAGSHARALFEIASSQEFFDRTP
ncbi:MAG: hypothetical protein ABL958_19605 [Bdellovibrionia bacterium]